MKKAWPIASLLIIILLGVTSVICVKGVFESLASRRVDDWLSDQPSIFTSQLTDEQKDGLVAELRSMAGEGSFTAISVDKESLQSGATLYTFSVLPASVDGEAVIDPLVILGTTLIDDALIKEVSFGSPDSYAGYGNDVFSRVSALPSIRSGMYLRVDRMDAGSDLGSSCALLSLEGGDFQSLVDRLSLAIGVAPETLTTEMSGSTSGLGLIYLFCAGAFALLSLILCLLMVTHSLLELKTLGVHLLLGWSKADFASELLSSQALQILVLIPIGLVGAFATFDGFAINAAFVGLALTSVLPAVVVELIAAAVAVAPLISARPVEAIHGRYSRRGFYGLAVAVYLVCLVAIFAGCLYIDQPLTMYADLARTRSAWQEYEGWYVVRDFSIGSARFTGNPMELSEDMYTWYAEHEHDDGVYLANAINYKESTIRAYAGSDTTLEQLRYLAASPSYLELIGVDVSADVIERAEQGTRVYLLPESLSASEANEVRDFLVAARRPSDSNIVTPFMENPEYEFITYDADAELFTWSTDSEEPVATGGFVIAIVTSENMVPFESESLVASGLENAYVKLDERAASSLLDADGMVGIGGSVNARFATVGNYIDGLQKTLEELFALFSTVLVVLVVTVSVMVACLVDVVNRVSAREISVKYVLGFGVWDLYRREVLFVTVTALLGVGVSSLFGSAAGVLVGVVLLAISNLVIAVVSRKGSAAVVLETVSKE